jgi:DNA processing protein
MHGTGVQEAHRFWIAFHHVPYVGPVRTRRVLDHVGSLERAWMADQRDLRAVLDERSCAALVKTRASLDLDLVLRRLEDAGVTVITIDDDAYPRLLREIHAPPSVLYVKGDLLPVDERAVAIVGTRRSTRYGAEVAARLAGDLAQAGVTIVSGLARGIDGVAHQAALEAGGRTLAVFGTGIHQIYPPQHRNLANRIGGSGALVSDYAPDRTVEAANFPARNRIISGLSRGVIVVEAPSRSGALITADFAGDQGRDVFAVPGSILSNASVGCNQLLRDGARVVTTAQDVLDELGFGEAAPHAAVQQSLLVPEEDRRLLAVLNAEPQHNDEIAAKLALPGPSVSAMLLTLELQGLVRNIGAQHYARGSS